MEERQAKAQVSRDEMENVRPNYLGLAQPLVSKGYYDIALVQLEEAEKEDGNNPEVFYLKGICLRQTEQFEEAEKAFKKAVEIMPDHAAAHNGLAVLYDRTSRHDEALPLYDKAIRLNPANASFYNCKGFSLVLAGDCQEAVRVLKKGLAIQADSKKMLNNLGIAYALCQDLDRSLAIFKRAGSEADACNNLGFAYEIQGNYASAMSMYQKALSLNYKHSQAKKNLERVQPFCIVEPASSHESNLLQ